MRIGYRTPCPGHDLDTIPGFCGPARHAATMRFKQPLRDPDNAPTVILVEQREISALVRPSPAHRGAPWRPGARVRGHQLEQDPSIGRPEVWDRLTGKSPLLLEKIPPPTTCRAEDLTKDEQPMTNRVFTGSRTRCRARSAVVADPGRAYPHEEGRLHVNIAFMESVHAVLPSIFSTPRSTGGRSTSPSIERERGPAEEG